MKKSLILTLCIVLCTCMALGGTMAYLTSTDDDVNVMTLGNVKIEQFEYERVQKADGDYEMVTSAKYGEGYKLKPFTQGKPLYPATGKITGWGTKVPFDQLGSGASGAQAVFAGLNNVQDKFVLVKNTGKSDAYVRTIIALEEGSNQKDIIGISTGDFWTWNEIGLAEIDSNNYYLYEAIYKGSDSRHQKGILPAGEYTYNSLGQIYLMNEATNEDVEALDGNKNGTYDVLVFSQAVQAAGFSDAKTALDTAFGKISADNHPWVNNAPSFNKEVVTEVPASGKINIENSPVMIDKPLVSVYEASVPYTIEGNGQTVTMVATALESFNWKGNIPSMSMVFSSENGEKVTVNNLNIEGSMQAVMAGHYVDSNSNWYNTEFNNVNIINPQVVSFSSNISPALVLYGTAVLNDCNVYGATLSPLDTDPMWPVYDVAAVNYSDVQINGGKYGSIFAWNQAKITIDDGAKVESIVVKGNMNTTKYGITVKAGTTVGTIDLSAITNKQKVNITIEAGANVGSIVANGNTYSSIADWQNN